MHMNPHLLSVYLLQSSAVVGQHLDTKPGGRVQVAAGVTFQPQYSQPGQMLQRG